MSVTRLMSELDSREIAEWMAYDKTNDEEWIKQYNKELELEMSRQMSDEQKLLAFKKLLGSR